MALLSAGTPHLSGCLSHDDADVGGASRRTPSSRSDNEKMLLPATQSAETNPFFAL